MRVKIQKSPSVVYFRLITVLVVATVGTAAMLQTHAQTPTANIEVESGARSGAVALTSDTTASGGNAVKFGVTVIPSGWPDASNTGYDSAPDYPGSLTTCTGTLQSNTTYRFCRFAPGLAVSNLTNVTFYGCRFDGADADAFTNVQVVGGNNITFDYASFIPRDYVAPPATGQIPHTGSSQFGLWVHPTNPGKITIDHSEFWGFGNGIQFFSAYDAAKPFTVRNSWFHDARADGGEDHTDGILQGDGSSRYVVIDHNTIVSLGNTNGLALQDDTDQDVTVTNNYFSGFGYTVTIGRGTNTNVVFTDNTFGTDIKPEWGPLYGWPSGSGNVWRRNKWHIAPGTTWSPASNDGKYWWPDGTLSNSDYTGP